MPKYALNNIGYPIKRRKLNIGLTNKKGSTIIEISIPLNWGRVRNQESYSYFEYDRCR
jgi:hypothetical protein